VTVQKSEIELLYLNTNLNGEIMRFIILTLLGQILSFNTFANPQDVNQDKSVINLATTEWCPYVCKNEQRGEGLILDYLREVLEAENISLNVNFFPWSRAIQEVRSGRLNGLVTAIKSEAPTLDFTNVPSMYYQMCFYTRRESTWIYQSEQDLANIKLGLISDYGYGEPVDSYAAQIHNYTNMIKIGGTDSLLRLEKLLAKKRIDAFIEDKHVVQWMFQQNALREAGCLSKIPFFMAFNPEYAEETEVIPLLDSLLSLAKNQKLFQQKYFPRYFD